MGVNDRPLLHAQHDELLVAASIAGGLEAYEATAVAGWIATCDACERLAVDLTGIRAATVALPAPRRTRDFRLTPEDVQRLRPTGLRAILDWFASPRLAFTAPLGSAVATLGIVGLLIGATSFGASTGLTSAPMAEPYAAPAAGGASADGAAPEAMSAPTTNLAAGPSVAAEAPTTMAADASRSAANVPIPEGGAAPPNPLIVGSGLLLIVGLLLVGLRIGARRAISVPARHPPSR